MPNNLIRERTVSLLNRDFQGFKRDLIRFTQAHQSGSFGDLNEASPGMALLEHMAYVGDVLSFYQDQQFNELKFEMARQVENVVSFAKSLGYRPSGKRAARGELMMMVEVPSTTNAVGELVPDDLYTPLVVKGAQVAGPAGTIFETLEDVQFSSSLGRLVTGSVFDSTTGLPTKFGLAKLVQMQAGETKTETFTIGAFEAFKTIELTNEDVLEVISVVDSDGNDWAEVDFLAQDMVFDSVPNYDSDLEVVPYVLKLVPVPRRFIVDRDPLTNKSSLVFGAGDGLNFDDELIPNLADLALPLAGRRTFTAFALDPQNFLKTRSLGLSPFSTTLTVKYRVGGGAQTNVPPRTIKTVTNASLDFIATNLDTSKKGAVEASISCINLKRTDGGGPEETIQEIKLNAPAFFAAQGRVVTKEDYITRVMSLPAKFGKPEKVLVRRNGGSALTVDVHVVSRDQSGHFALATANLKNNIVTYVSRFRMTTDGINIMDADILNLRVNFGIVTSPRFNRTEVLTKCLDVVRTFVDNDVMQIGQPLVISAIQAAIHAVDGVVSVYEMKFTNVFGTVAGFEYSTTRFDIQTNIRNGILYCPENAIFEVKFPRRDIVGVSK